MRIPHELQPLAKAARKAGWVIDVRGSGHLRWTSPDGLVITSAASPSSNRTSLYVRWKLRHAGLDI